MSETNLSPIATLQEELLYPAKTHQDAFNYVIPLLIKQGKRSAEDDNCLYFESDDVCCAVGWFLETEPDANIGGFDEEVAECALPEWRDLLISDSEHIEAGDLSSSFFFSLQRFVHDAPHLYLDEDKFKSDQEWVDQMKRAAKKFAEKWKLIYPEGCE